MEEQIVTLEINMREELANLKVGQSYNYIVKKALKKLEFPDCWKRWNWKVLKYRAKEEPDMKLKVEVTFGLELK